MIIDDSTLEFQNTCRPAGWETAAEYILSACPPFFRREP
jgi:hypothetical protein